MSIEAMTGLEAVRPWLGTGGILGILILVARYGAPLAKQVSEYLIERQKLRMQEKKDDRQGFGDLIEELRKEVSGLRAENATLRQEVRSLHSMIDGMRRGTLQDNLSAQRAVVDNLPEEMVTPAVRASLERIKGAGE